MKKLTLAVVVITLLLSANFAIAQTLPESPLVLVWKAINGLMGKTDNLQEQITNIQLIPGPQGEKGDKGDTGEQGIPGSGIKIVDAEGRLVGYPLSDIFPTIHIFNPALNQNLSYDMRSGQIYSISQTGNLWYETNNCSGQPYLNGIETPYTSLRYNPYTDEYYIVTSYEDIYTDLRIKSTRNFSNGQCTAMDSIENFAGKITVIDPPPTYVGPLRVVIE